MVNTDLIPRYITPVNETCICTYLIPSTHNTWGAGIAISYVCIYILVFIV